MHYRDDLDLQNLMDYIQKEVRAGKPLRPTARDPRDQSHCFFKAAEQEAAEAPGLRNLWPG